MVDKIKTLAILQILAQCDGYAMPEDLLFTTLNANLPVMERSAAIKEHLAFAKDKGFVDYLVDTYGDKKWFITDAGKIHRQSQHQ